MIWRNALRFSALRLLAPAALMLCCFALPSHAQTASASGGCPYWIDAATGEHVQTTTIPAGLSVDEYRNYSHAPDQNHTYMGGRNLVQQSDGTWIDAATGEHVQTTTIPAGLSVDEYRNYSHAPDQNHTYMGGRNLVLVPCPPPSEASTVNPPPTAEPVKSTGMAPLRGAAFNIGGIGVSAVTLAIDPGHFSPNVGANGDQWGFSAAGLVPLMDHLGVELDAGYHRVTSAGPGLDNWTAGASLVWRAEDWRLGPSFGFQSNSAGLVSTQTYNYGPYVDWFASPYLTLSAKGGGFSSSPAPDGFYAGGGIKGYATPNLVFNGAIDFTRFTSLPSSNETDYTIGAEYLLSQTIPISLFGGYTRNQFSPGTFHVDTVSFGLKLYFNGGGAATLVDRQRTGTLGSSALFAPLSLKF